MYIFVQCILDKRVTWNWVNILCSYKYNRYLPRTASWILLSGSSKCTNNPLYMASRCALYSTVSYLSSNESRYARKVLHTTTRTSLLLSSSRFSRSGYMLWRRSWPRSDPIVSNMRVMTRQLIRRVFWRSSSIVDIIWVSKSSTTGDSCNKETG